ncbi:MAG: (Fe-S)-binding protein [Candidatus Asgardarchaeia archaeon]
MPKEKLIPKAVEIARENVLKSKNPFGVPAEERYAWAKDLDLPKQHETIFFASCMNPLMGYGEALLSTAKKSEKVGIHFNTMMSLGKLAQKLKVDKLMTGIKKTNREYQETILHAIDVLKKLNVEFGFLYDDEPCCGGPLHTYGLLDDFQEHVKKVYSFLKERGVKRIITINPICGGIFKKFYPDVLETFDIEVKHFSEIVAEKIKEEGLSFKASKPKKVVFHDPCYLARFMRVVDEPRVILNSIEGWELVEPVNNKFDTKCDGGGGVEVVYPKIARKIAKDRMIELLDTGADLIVTACAPCIMMLKLGESELHRNVEIRDIVDVVYKALNNEL